MQLQQRTTALGLAVALSLAGCAKAPEPVHEDVRPVRTIVAGQSAGTVGSQYSGEIRARYESQLAFRANGKIVVRLVEVGSHVKRGQALMQLDTAQESLMLAAAGADVDAANGRVMQAKTDLARSQQLLQRQFASQAEVDHQALALQQAESQLRAARARQQLNANQRGYTTLVADKDGVVSALHAEAGQVVAAGQTVAVIAADGEREVAISVPESRVDELRQAKKLDVSLWAHPGQHWSGRLRELAPDTDGVTRTYSARITIAQPDPELVRLGMTASVLAPDVDGRSAIRLPLTAIVDGAAGGKRAVWVVDRATGRVSLREVQLGSAQDDSVLITKGLAGGETVVTAGVHMLQPNQRVLLVAAAAGKGGQS